MKKKPIPKLELSKETLRKLSEQETKQVVAGGATDHTCPNISVDCTDRCVSFAC